MEILYEDRNITVCIKEPGLSSEDRPGADTVPARLRARWGRPEAYVGVVHRLDTATGGVMVYARTKAAAAALSAQVAAGSMTKEYRCVCAGAPSPAAGEMQDWLFKDSRKNKVFPVKGPRRGAKEARLAYRVLAERPLTGGAAAACGQAVPQSGAAASGGVAVPARAGCLGTKAGQKEAAQTQAAQTAALGPAERTAAAQKDGPAAEPACAALCAVRLFTGRTHQIRVQFASRRHPLLGDGKYGSRAKGPLALWCCRLTFTPPGAAAPRTFTAPPPAAGFFAAFATEQYDL